MASLLLAALFAAIRRSGGATAGLIAVALLATAPFFIELASAVMIGLPSITFAVLALAAARPEGPSATQRSLVSGLLYGLSLQTKLFTFTMAPALLVAVTGIDKGGPSRSALRLALVWTVAGLATFAIVAVVSGQSPVASLVKTHLAPEIREQYALADSLGAIWQTLAGMPGLLVPGVLGLVALPALRDRRGAMLVPVLWLAAAAGALALHQPVHSHQVLLVVVPLAWLAGLFIASMGGLVTAQLHGSPGFTRAAPLILALAAIAPGLADLVRRPAERAQRQELSAHAVEVFAPLGGWVVVDQPLAAYVNGLLVPPDLVVFSEKRMTIGDLTDADIIASIDRRQPAQVLFQRFPMPETVAMHIAADYLVAERGVDGDYVQYVRRTPAVVPDRAALSERLRALVAAMERTSVGGGYAVAVDSATGERFGESGKVMTPDQIWMRPAGATYEVGVRFLAAYAATGEPGYRDAAIRTGLAVARSRTCHGGWEAAAAVAGGCTTEKTIEEFDEGMQGEAIDFLLDVAMAFPNDPAAGTLRTASHEALSFILDRQDRLGAWPLVAYKTSTYRKFSAIGDDVSTAHIRVLLRAYGISGDERYLAGARRGLEFLLAAQLKSGAWAQQYDKKLRPTAGRPFEPAAAASIETAMVIRTLLAAYESLGDERYLAAAQKAERWLTAAQVEPETWSRFYDLRSNRPIFGDRDGSVHFALDEISEERRAGYRWLGRFPDVVRAIRLVRAATAGREIYAAEKAEIDEARRLMRFAAAIRGSDDKLDEAPTLSTPRWLETMDGLLAELAFAPQH